MTELAPPAPYDLLAATWPPEIVERVGAWRVSHTEGAGRRVCSAWPLAQDAGALAADLPAVEAWYAARSLDPLVQTPDAVAEPLGLADRGYAPEGDTAIIAFDAAVVAARSYVESRRPYMIEISGPLAALDALWRDGGVGRARRAVIARAEPIGRILGVRLDHRLAGAAFVGRHGDAAALQALHVADWARRRGAGRDLVVAAARWARDAGAGRLILSVERDNAPALAMYHALGAREIGGYRYYRKKHSKGGPQ